jgi:hypothetical protein
MNRRSIAAVAAACACVSPPTRDPAACATPADRVEIEQVQIGWNRFDPGQRPPVVDPARPSRDPRQAESLAGDVLAQCRKGVPMDALQNRFSEVPGGSIVVGPQAKVPFKAAALCLQKNECVVVRGDVAFHVLKRIE